MVLPSRPVRARPLRGPLDPIAAIDVLRRPGPVVALETTRPSADHGAQIIVAAAPLATFTWERGAGRVEPLREDAAPLRDLFLADAPSPFHALERLLAAAAIPDGGGDAPPLGAFGWFGYECVAPPGLPRLAPFPDAWFVLCDTVVHWSEPDAPPVLWSASRDDRLAEELAARLAEAGARSAERASRARRARRDDASRTDRGAASVGGGSGLFAAHDLSLADYACPYAAVRDALLRGDAYQLCFTYPIERRFSGDPLELYRCLRAENPAPFAAYVEAPFGAIAGSSPERFLKVDRRGMIEARPMKGTAPRAEDVRERRRAACDLVASEKARAENLMIADLLRNDLGRVGRLGSVRATRPALLEEHASVLQLVSVIEGELDDGRTRADLLASAFPPGSMTGAPKVRAIELLRALEPEPRGPYSGALGYLAADGRMDFAVVIRSALLASGVARVNVGGGIVWDSRLEAEHAESRLKAEPMLRALARAAEAAR